MGTQRTHRWPDGPPPWNPFGDDDDRPDRKRVRADKTARGENPTPWVATRLARLEGRELRSFRVSVGLRASS